MNQFDAFKRFNKLNNEEIKELNSFLMLRYFSGNIYTSIPANIMNMYPIPVVNQYKFLNTYFNLAKIKPKFIKFYKIQEPTQEVIENIAKYYKINKKVAKEYYELMPEKDKKRFLSLYKEGRV